MEREGFVVRKMPTQPGTRFERIWILALLLFVCKSHENNPKQKKVREEEKSKTNPLVKLSVNSLNRDDFRTNR